MEMSSVGAGSVVLTHKREASDVTPGSNDAAGSDAPYNAVIVARGLQKRFDSTVVLRDLSMSVAAGEIFGLIGPSGSGKSTTIHLLCGHLRASGGEMAVLGSTPDKFTATIRRRIGYMPQGFALYPDLTVEQNVAFAAGLYGLPEWRNKARIRETLELVQLWDARKRAARAVSGGMQRRIALAAALVHDPEIIFMDEPTANLDPILRAHLWEHFRALRERGRALLITTQYVDEAEYCDRVGLMYGGSLIATGRPLGTVKLSTIDSNDDRKVGSSPRLRALISPQAQHLRALIGLRWGGFVQSKLNVTVPTGQPGGTCCQVLSTGGTRG